MGQPSQLERAKVIEQLARLSADGGGMEAICRALVGMVHKGVLIQDKRLSPLAEGGGEDFENWDEILQALATHSYLPRELVDRKRAQEVREPIVQVFQTCARLISPIVTRGVARGYLSFIARDYSFDSTDRMVMAEGALIAAVEMAKVKAVSVAEKRIRGDLVDAVLGQTISPKEAERWAERAGLRRTGPFTALAMQWAGSETPSLRRLETIVSGHSKRLRNRTFASARDGEIAVFLAVGADRGIEEARRFAQAIMDQARAEFPSAHLAIGIGRPVSDLMQLPQSFREASQAMRLEARLRHHRPQYFGDLGVYRLLLSLEQTQELSLFAQQVLGAVIQYDAKEKSNLIETLQAVFNQNFNLARTAQALFVHRNTLAYRLGRIEELLGCDLDDAETRLKVQLALKALELSQPPQPGG